MRSDKNEIERWLEMGKELTAVYMLVVSDRKTYQRYPVFISENGSLVVKLSQILQSEQLVDEIYNFKAPLEQQINKVRSWKIAA